MYLMANKYRIAEIFAGANFCGIACQPFFVVLFFVSLSAIAACAPRHIV